MRTIRIDNPDIVNEEALALLYSEIRFDLQLTSAAEEFGDTAKDVVVSGLKYISKKLGYLVTRLLHSMRNVAEKAFSRYESIMFRWNKRLSSNISNIDSVAFENRKISVVPREVLLARIDAIHKVHHLLDNIGQVCESQIRQGSNDFRTSEIMSAFRAMSDIGFDANRYNLVKQVSSLYDDAREHATLENLGYSTSELPTIISRISGIAKYANSSDVKKLNLRFVAYADKLTEYEKSIKEQEDLSFEEKEELLHTVDIKIARLWWIAHFIKAAYVVTGDIVIDILKICKTAEQCIPSE